MTHEQKVTPEMAQEMTDAKESGATLRQLAAKYSVGKTTVERHVGRELERRAAQAAEVADERRQRAAHRADRAPASRPPGKVRLESQADMLDRADASIHLRQSRATERGLTPRYVKIAGPMAIAFDMTDAEWSAYVSTRTDEQLAARGIDMASATRSWPRPQRTERTPQ